MSISDIVIFEQLGPDHLLKVPAKFNQKSVSTVGPLDQKICPIHLTTQIMKISFNTDQTLKKYIQISVVIINNIYNTESAIKYKQRYNNLNCKITIEYGRKLI